MLLQLQFDSFGWWNADSKNQLIRAGDRVGWFGVTSPPLQTPYFVVGAKTAEEAIAAGMPVDAATQGSIKTPSMLLD